MMGFVAEVGLPWLTTVLAMLVLGSVVCQLDAADPVRAKIVPVRWYAWVASRLCLALGMLARIISVHAPQAISPDLATLLTLVGLALWAVTRRKREPQA